MNKNKWLSLLVAMIMLFTCIPFGTFAEGDDAEPVTVEETTVVVEAPAEEPAPAAEEPAAEEPAAEEPAAEEPAAEEPAAEEPAAEELAVEEPAAEEPAVEEPVAEEPAADEPAVDEPAADEPAVDEPAAEEPAAEEPAGDEPAADEPAAEEPAGDEPAAEEPAADAFVAGLAKLSAGDVFADEKLKETFGKVNSEAIVFAVARVDGEGELTKDDIIRIALNINGEIKTLYVKNGSLKYLDEEEAAAYQKQNHNDGIEYRNVKLDAVDFVPVIAEIEETEEVVEIGETDEIVEVEVADAGAAWNDPPTNLTATINGTTVTLTWDHSAEAEVEAYGVYEIVGGKGTLLKAVTAKTYTISDVTEGDHEYAVAARKKIDGSWKIGTRCAPVAVTVALPTAAWNDAPINLTATADGTTVTLTWDHAAEAEVEAYGVYEIVGGKGTLLKAVTAKTYTISDVTEGDHEYAVAARKKIDGSWKVGTRCAPVAVTVTLPTAAWDDAPINLTATADGTTVTLTWEHAAEAEVEAYGVYEIVGGKGTLLKAVTTKTYTINDVTEGDHEYAVAARKKINGSWKVGTRCTPVAVTVTLPTAAWDDAPINLTATAEGTTVTLTWEHAVEAEVEAYGVYEIVGGKGTLLKAVTTKTYTINDVTEGDHEYAVAARKKIDGSWKIGTRCAPVAVTVTLPTAAWDDAPINLTATADGTTVTLAWEHAVEAEVEAYGVYEIVGGKGTLLKVVTTKTYTISDVTEGDHEYAVAARKKIDGSWKIGTRCAPVTVTVALPTAAWNDAPINLTATADGTTVTLTWDHAAEAEVEAYGVYEIIGGKGTLLKIVTAKTYTISDVTEGDHEYAVAARKKISGSWKIGTRCEPVGVTIVAAQWNDAPINLTATADGTTVTLTWDHAAEAEVEAYGVYEIVGGKGTLLKAVTAKTYTISDVTEGDHEYAVAARKKIDGSWKIGTRCEPVGVTIIAPQWDDPPINLTAVVNGTTVTLTWEHAAEAEVEAYGVYEIVSGKGTLLKIVTDKTYTINNVTEGEHEYAVAARKKIDGSWKIGTRCEPVTASITGFVVDDVTYRIEDNALTVVSYTGTASSVTIPQEIEGLTVKRIGESAFEGNTNLVSIDLPDTITVIEARAFKNCTNLREMN